jgi:hypothetical protein
MKHQAVRAYGAVYGSELSPSHHDRFTPHEPIGLYAGWAHRRSGRFEEKNLPDANQISIPLSSSP